MEDVRTPYQTEWVSPPRTKPLLLFALIVLFVIGATLVALLVRPPEPPRTIPPTLEQGVIPLEPVPATTFPAAVPSTAAPSTHALPPLHEARPSAQYSVDEHERQLRRVMVGHMAAFRRCYERQLREDPDLAGRVTVQVALDAQGAVARSTATDESLGDPAVRDCVARTARSLQFPAPPEGSKATYSFPFVFHPGEGG